MSFYKDVDTKRYVNAYYSLTIALENYLAGLVLNNDLKRVIVSSTDYALVKRSGKEELNNANFPFINYKMVGKSVGGDRNWFSMEGFAQGIYIDGLRKKLRVAPITITFDSTAWFSRDDDYQYALDKLLLDAAAETKIAYTLDYNGVLVKNIAIITYTPDASPKFTESDWLERNKIWTIGLDFNIQTWLPIDTAEGFCIPKEIILNYATEKGLPDGTGVTEDETVYKFAINHLTETITEE